MKLIIGKIGNLVYYPVIIQKEDLASAAEIFIDAAHNVENVLFIGENSYGCLIGDAGTASLRLPYSKFTFKFGSTLRFFLGMDPIFKKDENLCQIYGYLQMKQKNWLLNLLKNIIIRLKTYLCEIQ